GESSEEYTTRFLSIVPKLNRQYCWQDYLLKGQQPLLKKWRHVIIQKICFARLERISPSNDTVVLKYPTRKILKLDTLIFPVIYHLQHISQPQLLFFLVVI